MFHKNKVGPLCVSKGAWPIKSLGFTEICIVIVIVIVMVIVIVIIVIVIVTIVIISPPPNKKPPPPPPYNLTSLGGHFMRGVIVGWVPHPLPPLIK